MPKLVLIIFRVGYTCSNWLTGTCLPLHYYLDLHWKELLSAGFMVSMGVKSGENHIIKLSYIYHRHKSCINNKPCYEVLTGKVP